MEYFTPAIVLSRHDVKEYDRLFSLYTKNLGKTTVMAKGIRRITSKMAGHLEPFSLLMVKIIGGRGTNKLSNVETVECYQNIIKDLELMKLAARCTSAVEELVKEGSCDLKILELIEKVLSLIDREDKSLVCKKTVVSAFLWQLISHLGYQPELYSCLVCKEKILPAGNGFDFLKGGLVCSRCKAGAREISEEEIKVLRLFLKEKLEFFIDNKINNRLAASAGEVVLGFLKMVKNQ